MRVLLITGEFPPMVGGVGDYTACLAGALHHLGVEVSVLTSARCVPPEGSFPFRVEGRVALWNYGSWGWVRREISRRRADIIHIQYQAAAYGLHPAINLLPAVLRVTEAGCRTVVTFHDLKVPYIFPKAGPLRKWAVRFMARRSSGVICTDEADLNRVSGWGLQSTVRLVPIGSNIPVVDTGRAPSRDLHGGDTPVIGYFGLLNSSKGIEELFRAYRLLQKRGLGAKLVMIGADLGDSDPTNAAYARRVRAIAGELDVGGMTSWTGQLSPSDTSRALQGLDICVLPYLDGASFRRGTLMAALAHGLPIITTRPRYQPASGPVLSDGDNCRLVLPGDVGALAEAIEELAGSPSLRERLARGALDLSRHFTWQEIASKTNAVFQEVLPRPGR